MKSISCIIPAFNEEHRITGVLRSIEDHPLISEIIVVDDDSSDRTVEEVKKFKSVRLITQLKNQGKSRAVERGIGESKGDFILLLDADLVGMTARDVTALIEPVIKGEAEVTISLRRNAPGLWHMIGLDYISGERVFPRSVVLPHLEKIGKLPGYGLEVYLNKVIIKNRYRIKVVHWDQTDSIYKYKKYGWVKGIKGDIKMMYDIFATISPFGPFYQIVKMLRLRV